MQVGFSTLSSCTYIVYWAYLIENVNQVYEKERIKIFFLTSKDSLRKWP